jgi:uncharacterized protein YecE (DUF72 family)
MSPSPGVDLTSVSAPTASVAEGVAFGGSTVLVGATSWADRGLVRDGRFYPRKTMTATERLGYYTTRLPLAEIATTAGFPPTPQLCQQWVERTPDGFCFDVRGWSLLTGAPTMPDSLYPDLVDQVRPSSRDRRRLYSSHLSPEALEECWARFAHALGPLARAGRLGVVILRYPSWVSPRPEAWAELVRARERLADFRVAVELSSPKWFAGAQCDDTLEWLEDHDLGFVCIDGPDSGPRATPTVVAATSDIAVVRFDGRRAVVDEPWTWPYRYDPAELAAWIPRLEELASSARQVHVLFGNGWRSDAVDNAGELLDLLRLAATDSSLRVSVAQAASGTQAAPGTQAACGTGGVSGGTSHPIEPMAACTTEP